MILFSLISLSVLFNVLFSRFDSFVSTYLTLAVGYLVWTAAFRSDHFHNVWALAFVLHSGTLLLSQSVHTWSGKISLMPFTTACGFACVYLSPLRPILEYQLKPKHGVLIDSPTKAEQYRPFEIYLPTGLAEGKEPNADIVVVHGFGAHPDQTYQPRDDKGGFQPISWVKDFLPKEDFHARVLRFAHRTQWKTDASYSSMYELGKDLLCALEPLRAENGTRPLIFIAHSMGGLIVKQALVNAVSAQNEYGADILKSTKGIIFLGTPHRGANFTALGRMLALLGYWTGSDTTMLDAQQCGSKINEALHNDFLALCRKAQRNIDLVCVFEREPEKHFGLTLMETVPKASATIDQAEEMGFYRSHRELQRFDDEHDTDYQFIIRKLRVWICSCYPADRAVASNQLDTLELTGKHNAHPLDQDLLESLCFENIFKRRDNIPDCDVDTCKWILDKENFRTWHDRDQGMFLIKGAPGSGKSTMMKYLYARSEEASATDSSLNIDAFIHGQGSALQKSFAGLLRSLLYQLALAFDTVHFRLSTAYKSKKIHRSSDSEVWNLPELQRLLREGLLSDISSKKLTVWIDALDEMGGGAREVMKYIVKLSRDLEQAGSNVKICVACREAPNLADLPNFQLCLHEHNTDAVTRFLTGTLDRAQLTGGAELPPREWETTVDQLAQRASSSFLWAQLVVKKAEDLVASGVTISEIYRRLLEVPQELAELYKHILMNAVDSEDLPKTYRLLQWVCLSVYPLNIHNIGFAMAADRPEELPDNYHQMIRRIKALSGGLVTVRFSVQTESHYRYETGVAELVHQSFSDFLEAEGFAFLAQMCQSRSELLSPLRLADWHISEICHLELAFACLAVLYCQGEPPKDRVDLNNVQRYSFMEYAIRSLFWHASLAGALFFHVEHDWLRRLIHNNYSKYASWAQQFIRPSDTNDSYLVRPNSGATLLHTASAWDMVDWVAELLDTGESLDATDENGMTPLIYAMRNDSKRTQDVLLSKGADLRLSTHGGLSLHLAIRQENVSLTRLLLQKGISAIGGQYSIFGLVTQAADMGQVQIVKAFMDAGVAAEGDWFTAALRSAYRSNNREFLDLLLSYNNMTDLDLMESLHFAVMDNNMEAVRTLVKLGAVAIYFMNGHTTLTYAIKENQMEMVRIFLTQDIYVGYMEGTSASPIGLAIEAHNDELLHLLIEAGADVNESIPGHFLIAGGQTLAIIEAVTHGSLGTIQTLLDAGADVNKLRVDNVSALFHAVRRGEKPKVQLLLSAGANINVECFGFKDILQAAIHFGDQTIVDVIEQTILESK